MALSRRVAFCPPPPSGTRLSPPIYVRGAIQVPFPSELVNGMYPPQSALRVGSPSLHKSLPNIGAEVGIYNFSILDRAALF
jgi:hypothetical protein